MENLIANILKNENISFEILKRSTSGFTNVVYFIDDKFVIKLSNDKETKKQLEKETSVYKNIKLTNIPKFVASGEYQDYSYLIITKLQGKGLFSVWHELSETERKSCVFQIANILKSFNAQNADFLSDRYKYYDWKNHIKQKFQNRKNGLDSLGEDSSQLKKLIESDFDGVFDNDNRFGLVYNDAHFDNFLYDEKTTKVSLIDFDRVIFAPIDYEMLIFKTMCDNALKFASEEDESVVVNNEYNFVYDWFKQAYPEMFEIDNIEKRVKLYQYNYLIRQAIEWENPKSKIWREKLSKDLENIYDSDIILTSSV